MSAVAGGVRDTVPLSQRLAARGLDGLTLLVLPAALFLVPTFVYPFLYGLFLSFTPKAGGAWANYARFFSDPFLWNTIGTTLWLGDREALSVGATVLDAHPVERGDVYGYRGRTAPAAGTILVVSGGTAHGIGLEAPTGGATLP